MIEETQFCKYNNLTQDLNFKRKTFRLPIGSTHKMRLSLLAAPPRNPKDKETSRSCHCLFSRVRVRSTKTQQTRKSTRKPTSRRSPARAFLHLLIPLESSPATPKRSHYYVCDGEQAHTLTSTPEHEKPSVITSLLLFTPECRQKPVGRDGLELPFQLSSCAQSVRQSHYNVQKTVSFFPATCSRPAGSLNSAADN